MGFILDKKEFYDRNSSDKQVWTNATPVLNNLFATTFSQKKWRTDFTPGTSSGDDKCADESSDLNTSTESVKAVTNYGVRKKKKSNLMTEVMENSQKASAAATKALVTEMSADNAKMFAGFITAGRTRARSCGNWT